MINYSIIIPTFRREKELINCLELLYPQLNVKLGIEIIVSSDDTVSDNLLEKFNWVTFLNGPRKGPAANRNSAAKNAKGAWLFFIDDDCLPQSNWLNEAIVATKDEQGVFCIEGKTLAIGEKKCFDEVAPINENGGKLWSCNFGIKKDIFLQIGGFDEQFPIATMEDIDFKIRFESIGEIRFVSEMLAYHPWRRKKAFGNFNQRLLSQKQFKNKHYNQSISKFRIQRISIFINSIPINIIQLFKYQGRGFAFFLDKTIMNFCMIFI